MTKKILKRAEGVEGEKVLSKFSPSTVNLEERTVKCVLATKRKVYRSSWWEEPFYEVLSTDPKHIRTERLDNGIPVLDGHDWSGSVLNQLGIAKGYEVVGEEIETVLRFSKKPDAETVFQDVIDGILTTTSIGYRVFEYEDISPEDRQPGEAATFKAIDYEIFEISMVPIPADPGALLRSDKGENMSKKLKRTEEEEQTKAKKAEGENEEEEEETTESTEGDSADESEEEKETEKVKAEDSDDEEEEEEEEGEERSLQIMKMARTAGLDLEKTEALIRSKSSIKDISNKILSDMAARQGGAKMSKVEIIGDEKAVKREGMRNAILLRSGSKSVTMDENSRRFMNMRLLDMVRNYLGLGWEASNDEVARRAFHSSSDFANILTDAVNISLAFEYEAIKQTFEPIVKRGILTDFREAAIIDYGSFPRLQEVKELGEIKAGSLSDGKNVKKLKSYASKIKISRQTIINDTLDVFSKMPQLAAQSGRDLEADLVYEILTSNPTMGDGVALFHATHGNLSAGATGVNLASVAKAIKQMKLQKGLNGKPITVIPEYIVAPVALEAEALQFLNTNFMAAKQSDTNPYASTFKGVVTDQRLDAASATTFYLSAAAGRAGVIELDTLNGEGMKLNVEEKFADGIVYEALYDIGAAPSDHKGLQKVTA